MGNIREPIPVKLFTGILTSIPDILPEVEAGLVDLLGAVDLKQGPFPFDFTHYYRKSMGVPLQRYFYGFEDLADPSILAGIKVKTNDLEARHASRPTGVARPVNLDPGYLEQSKLVLASTKNFYHRIFLADGIYGEITLYFQEGVWQALPWTFPDYGSGCYDDFFNSLRARYRSQLAASCRRKAPETGS